MPPKPKFTKEEIVEAALQIVSQKGSEGLTARELGNALGSSARPIFTVFRNMEELEEEVSRTALLRFGEYAEEPMPGIPLFKKAGMKMVLFGVKEPKLYQLLFMRENESGSSFEELYGKLGKTADRCISAIREDYALSTEEAKLLFENVWIYTFGVGALCATKVCSFSEQEIGKLLTTEFQAVLRLIKSDGIQ